MKIFTAAFIFTLCTISATHAMSHAPQQKIKHAAFQQFIQQRFKHIEEYYKHELTYALPTTYTRKFKNKIKELMKVNADKSFDDALPSYEKLFNEETVVYKCYLIYHLQKIDSQTLELFEEFKGEFRGGQWGTLGILLAFNRYIVPILESMGITCRPTFEIIVLSLLTNLVTPDLVKGPASAVEYAVFKFFYILRDEQYKKKLQFANHFTNIINKNYAL